MNRYDNPNYNRRAGFGMNLYLNKSQKKIAGVCAGLADHFDINRNIMRIIFVAAILFTGMTIVWLYIIAWVILCEKPSEAPPVEQEYDETNRCYRKKNMFRYNREPSERIRSANERIRALSERISSMEKYVVSKRFKLEEEFSDLETGKSS